MVSLNLTLTIELAKKVGSMNPQPRSEVESRKFYFMLLPFFYVVKIASIAPIGGEKVERCFRQPACDCDDRRDRT